MTDSPKGESAMKIRKIRKVIKSKPTIEGAGVHLQRAFGFGEHARLRSLPAARRFPLRRSRRTTWRAFPGIPTAASRPSPTSWTGTWSTATAWGTSGVIAAGDVQWMTAGSGIIHQEMPKGDQTGRMRRLSALGQSSRVAQDDGPPLPEVKKPRSRRSPGRRRHAWSVSSAEPSGA